MCILFKLQNSIQATKFHCNKMAIIIPQPKIIGHKLYDAFCPQPDRNIIFHHSVLQLHGTHNSMHKNIDIH